MTNYEKIADFIYSKTNGDGEVCQCDLCYYYDTDLCENGVNYQNCIRGISIKLYEVTENE